MKAPFVKLFIKDFAFDVAGMTDAEIGKMMKAAIETYRNGKTPEKYENFSIFKAISDANVNYLTICERNKRNRTKSNTYNDQSSTSRQPVDDQSSTSLVNQNQNQNQNTEIKEKNTKKESLPLALCDFDEFWKAYPKKTGKQKAQTCYQSALKKTSHATIMHGLSRYNEYIRMNKTEDRYIKHPQTWLNAGCWLDEYKDLPLLNRTPAKQELTADELFSRAVDFFKLTGQWNIDRPRPDSERALTEYTPTELQIAAKFGYGVKIAC